MIADREVHINGLNWEVIKTLTLQYKYATFP